MRYVSRATEHRFVVPGPAVSFRSPQASSYKSKVAEAAAPLFLAPLTGAVDVRIDYFHRGGRRMDMDNIAKCVLDGLNGVAYVDDRQVASQDSREHDITGLISIVDSIDVIKPLAEHPQYLFVRLREGAT